MYPDEYWEGKPLNFKEGRDYTLAAGLGQYETILPDFDLRAIFTNEYIIEFGYNTNNRDDFNIVYVRGDFDVSGGSFRGGIMTDYTWSHVSPNMGSKDISVITYFTGSQYLSRSNYNDKTWHMNYSNGEQTIQYHQRYHSDGGISWSRRAGIQSNGISELVSYEELHDDSYSVSDINAMMLSDGMPGILNFNNLRIDYDLVDTRSKFGFNETSFGSGPDSSTNKDYLVTTDGIDTLTGVKKQRDTFSFETPPEYGPAIDKITNFSIRDKDLLQFSTSAFGVLVGKFAIAINAKKLSKLLASDTNFIYSQKSGELYFNANGPEPDFGVNGGVFAVLEDHPKLLRSSVSFV
jgi:hypothetical protein